jgi:uroporphyrinogen III methyltransferase/synthase
MKKLASRCALASIGPVTSRTLRSLGLRVACQASRYTLDGLVTAIVRHAKRRP